MQDIVRTSESVAIRRFALILLGIFAGVAILLAAVGTYGVMAYAVADRTREIGVRMALGAPNTTVLSQVLVDAAKLTLTGLIIGAVAAQGFTRFLTSMLFGITTSDKVTYPSVSCVLAVVAFLASYVPARPRSIRLSPSGRSKSVRYVRRSAITGSTRVARRAGTSVAIITTNSNSTHAAAIVGASIAERPNN